MTKTEFCRRNQMTKTEFCRRNQISTEKIFKFFLTVNQVLTKKLEKNWKKIWSVQKMVVSLHRETKGKETLNKKKV